MDTQPPGNLVPSSGEPVDPPPSTPKSKVVLWREEYSIKHSSGPLPSPEILLEYEKAIPGAADRIITMAENQARHRQALESQCLRSGIWHERLGIIAGFIIAIIGLLCGTFCIVNDQPWAGSVIAGTPLAGLVGVFVIGRKNQDEPVSEKQKSDDESNRKRKGRKAG